MTWFFIALAAPLLWSMVNHIDKYLLKRYASYAETSSVGSLFIFSTLVGFPVMLIALAVEPEVLMIPGSSILILFLSGMLGALFTLLYFYAILQDEASVVMPFFQTVPIFGMLLGYLFLGEKLTEFQVLAMLLILAGAAILSVDWEGGRKFKGRLVGFVLSSAFFFALQQVVFKVGARIEENFWEGVFWSHAGLFAVGAMAFLLVAPYRREFMGRMRGNSLPIFGLNIVNESLTIVGNALVWYAALLVPVALVLTVELYQPLFVLVLGIFITKFTPWFGEERLDRKHLSIKAISILIVFLGSVLLYYAS